jgi:hypothetical protein
MDQRINHLFHTTMPGLIVRCLVAMHNMEVAVTAMLEVLMIIEIKATAT